MLLGGPKHRLLALSLTCSKWWNICLPEVFDEIVIGGDTEHAFKKMRSRNWYDPARNPLRFTK